MHLKDDRSVKRYNNLERVDENKDSYSLNYHISCNKVDVLENNLPTRLTKAFTHLAELCGAKVIKDVF